MNFRKSVLLGTVALSVFALAGCKGATNTKKAAATTPVPSVDEQGAVVITNDGKGFNPVQAKAKVGQKIMVKNTSGGKIRLNSDPHPTHTLYPELNLDEIDPGTSKSLSFSKVGTYTYHNHLNPSQKGTIIVQ